LVEHLPGISRVGVHQLAELTPDIAVTGQALTAGGIGHGHLRTLELLRSNLLITSIHAGVAGVGHQGAVHVHHAFFQSTLGLLSRRLNRIGAFRTEELLGVIAQLIGIGQDLQHRFAISSGRGQHILHTGDVLVLLGESLGLVVLMLQRLQQRIFHLAGVGVELDGCFSAEVAQNLKRLIGDVVEVGITALRGALSGLQLSELSGLRLSRHRLLRCLRCQILDVRCR